MRIGDEPKKRKVRTVRWDATVKHEEGNRTWKSADETSLVWPELRALRQQASALDS